MIWHAFLFQKIKQKLYIVKNTFPLEKGTRQLHSLDATTIK